METKRTSKGRSPTKDDELYSRTSQELEPPNDRYQSRHGKQKDRIKALHLEPTNETAPLTIPLDWSYAAPYEPVGAASADGNGTIQATMTTRAVETLPYSETGPTREYRFNVIVALEWSPPPKQQKQLIEAFKRASAFLYDVTDGGMAFGQIVLGGMELMDCADIQILASNRFNPRSWVNGLTIDTKYMPIRGGRGLWHKNQRRTIPWVEPEGYRTLIHEWAHYALGLRDEYLAVHDVFIPSRVDPGSRSSLSLVRAPYTLVVPSISLATESIMGSLEGTSEIVPLSSGDTAKRKERVWQEIRERYTQINPDAQPNSGPYTLPDDLINPPIFFVRSPNVEESRTLVPTLKLPDQIAKNLLERHGELLLTVPPSIMDEHCWAYVVREDQNEPIQVIAQGTFDARSPIDGFRLLNATVGDVVLLIGEHADGEPIVLQGKIAGTEPIEQSDDVRAIVDWHEATPDEFPMVDVVPMPCKPTDPTAKVRLRITSTALPESVWLFPLGQKERRANRQRATADRSDRSWLGAETDVEMLDGHVLMRWDDGKASICTFSQGGGPATHVAVQSSPITAGSAEGNVMIFFKNEDGSQRYGNVRIVTTLIHGAPETLPDGAECRSYLFSIASNDALPINLMPTLVMYFDSGTDRADGDLIIHRRDENENWQPMPSYIPAGSSFAAMPMDRETAPNLAARGDGPRAEHYRLFWVPYHTSSGNEAIDQPAQNGEAAV